MNEPNFCRNMLWESKTQVMSCELLVQMYELQVQLYELRVQTHELGD